MNRSEIMATSVELVQALVLKPLRVMKSKFQDFSSQGSDSEDSVIGPCSEVNPLFRPLHCNLQF